MASAGLISRDPLIHCGLETLTFCAEMVVRKVAAREFWPPAERVKYDDFEEVAMKRPLAAGFESPARGEVANSELRSTP